MFKIAVLLAMLAVVMGTTGMPDDETEIETDRIKGTGVESSRSAMKDLSFKKVWMSLATIIFSA